MNSPLSSKPFAGPVPHAIDEGREDCLFCHGLNTLYPYTLWHTDRELRNQNCLVCHKLPDEDAALLPTVPLPDIPSFNNDILPVLEANCTECHGPDDSLNLTSYESVIAGSEGGPVINPGDAEHSRLCLVQRMPLAAHPTHLDPGDLALICTWVHAGALDN
ncbi:MAG TPA: hypothetical protein G4N94_06895 [Caldilineae bacterium]|nr:hypothetical protein [Caldilineae bacterium]